jgi:putative ABC transporter PGF-CTERM-modified substrate-binding protein
MDTTRFAVAALVVVAALGSPGVGAAAAAGNCTFPTTHTDATGASVTVPADPETVVTLNPSAAQTMYEIDAWEQVIGVSQFASYLPGADEKADVGIGDTDATVEQTLALDPDLVLAPNTIPDSTVAQLRSGGLTVYRFEEAEDLEDVVEKTRLTGELVGACESADSRADEMERQLDVIETAVADEDRPRLFYTTFGFTAGDDTYIHEVIETAGGDNVADDRSGMNANGASTSGYYLANTAVVVEADPEWFVLDSAQYDTATVPSGPNGVYEDTTAYQEGNAVVLDANEISQPAPRIVNAVLDLVRVLHPEAYENEIQGRIADETLDGESRTTADRLADGSLRLQAANLGRADAVRFDVPPRPNATAQVRRVDVALASVNPTFELRLRDGAGDRAAPNGTRVLQSTTLAGNGIYARDVRHLTLRLAVNRSRLDGADPDEITLYRANESGWVPLRTTRVAATNATAGGGNASAAANDTLMIEGRTTAFSPLALAVPDPAARTNGTVASTATPTAAPPTATATPTPGASTPGASTTETPPSTPGSAPGFGPVVALAALLLAAAAGVRR